MIIFAKLTRGVTLFKNGVTMSPTKKAVGEKKFDSDIVSLSPVAIVKPLCVFALS